MLLAAAAVAQNQFVYTNDNLTFYVNLEPANTVSAFQVQNDGSLSLIAGSPFPTGGAGGGHDIDPGEITVATQSNASFLYAANNGSGTISAFTINPSSGTLVRVAGSPFFADGPPGGDYSLAASPDGKFLYATADTSKLIHIYSISSTGALTQISGSPFPAGANTQGLTVTANGKFLIAGEAFGATAVAVYSIASGGTLSAVAGSPYPAASGVLGVVSNCASNLVFAISQVVDVYSMDSKGVLTAVSGEPFPNGSHYTSGGLALSPNSQFLFVTDTFSSDVTSFSINADGDLALVSGSPFITSSWTGGVAVTHSGQYVYSSLFTYAQVDGRQIGANGELTAVPGTPFSTGQSQSGVPTLTTFPTPSCSAQ
jgi:6-phosphogluconolactonase (cycloisomerase 2 family)